MTANRVRKVENHVPIRNVIVSLSDKEGIDVFAEALLELSPELRIFSTGGTFRKLQELLGSSSARLVELSSYTGQPEMEGGLVKSLDFHVHAGILAESGNEAHRAFLARIDAVYFDMVVVNLYPFQETVATPGADIEDARGNIDIGGPTMLRAAAKNFLRVAAVSNPGRYESLLCELRDSGGSLSLETRFSLARESFNHTRQYEEAIAAYLETVDPESLAATYGME